jgi:hypothetical protein
LDVGYPRNDFPELLMNKNKAINPYYLPSENYYLLQWELIKERAEKILS